MTDEERAELRQAAEGCGSEPWYADLGRVMAMGDDGDTEICAFALLARGLGLTEIAKILGVPVTTAANRIRYARERLRTLLARRR